MRNRDFKETLGGVLACVAILLFLGVGIYYCLFNNLAEDGNFTSESVKPFVIWVIVVLVSSELLILSGVLDDTDYVKEHGVGLDFKFIVFALALASEFIWTLFVVIVHEILKCLFKSLSQISPESWIKGLTVFGLVLFISAAIICALWLVSWFNKKAYDWRRS